MNIVVLNGSPSGKDSITLFTVLYLQKHFPDHHYEILHVGQQIRKMEKDHVIWQKTLETADLILFCYPVYTFLAPAQLHRFIEMIKENGVDLSGKYATQVTTSKHFYDVTAHQFIQDNCNDLGMHFIRGLSADMDDLLQRLLGRAVQLRRGHIDVTAAAQALHDCLYVDLAQRTS